MGKGQNLGCGIISDPANKRHIVPRALFRDAEFGVILRDLQSKGATINMGKIVTNGAEVKVLFVVDNDKHEVAQEIRKQLSNYIIKHADKTK